MKGTLALLDFEDPSIQGVQTLMVRAAMLPPFLRCADGRKFIAHLFTLHVRCLICLLLLTVQLAVLHGVSIVGYLFRGT